MADSVRNRGSRTYCVLDSLEFRLAEEVHEAISRWDVLTEFEKKKLRLLALIVKLSHRNKTLAKLLFLQNSQYIVDEIVDLKEFMPKHGKKPGGQFPLKFIMDLLKCSHRTAQAYQLTMKGMTLANEVQDEVVKLLAQFKTGKQDLCYQREPVKR
ncbi:MAG: hypothetical protein PVH12_02680 [Candidatus Bathyarchaeota archaeon]|jgi:hypothetical protein